MIAKRTKKLEAFIENVFGTDGFALFCGAGISFNSGIPLAGQIQHEILAEVLLRQIPKHCSWASHPLGDDHMKSKKRIGKILKTKVPFEVIMEAALMRGCDEILEVFNSRTPNRNHLSIASLTNHGVVKTIFTTNFDTLIEQAMDKAVGESEEELKRCSYSVLHESDHVRSWSGTEASGDVVLIKLHGCISDISSLKTTISKVAERQLADSVRPPLEALLQTGPHDTVVFTGYSFSDAFDINPVIDSIDSSSKQLIWLDHAAKQCDIRSFADIRTPNVLSKFNGWRIRCDTAEFINCLATCYNTPLTERSDEKVFGWEAFIKKWGDATSEHNNWHNYMMMGFLYSRIGDHRHAIPFLERAAWISSQAEDAEAESYIHSLISGCYQYLERPEMQELHSRKARAHSANRGESGFFAVLSQGRARYENKDFAEAEKIFRSLLEEPETKDGGLRARVYIGLAIANHGLGRFKDSIELSKRSLALSQEHGNLVNQCSSCMNLGLAYADMGDHQASRAANEAALSIARRMGNSRLCRNIKANMRRNTPGRCWLGIERKLRGIFGRLRPIP